jgi:hypothetical protein
MVADDIQYVREVRPLEFPDGDPEWHMGETTEHQLLCEVLRDLLRMAVSDQMVCSDQFVYFDAANPARKCAPDAFVKLGTAWAPVKSWRTWERGVPELCIEILSPGEFEKLTLEEKLARFLAMGVPEVVAFDPDGKPGSRLLAWDRIQGDLVERKVENECTPCRTLGMVFVIAPATLHRVEAALRLWDPARNSLIPTLAEAERTAKEAERSAKEAERSAKENALTEISRLKELIARTSR